MPTHPGSKSSRGFTLIELLASMAIISIVMLLLLSLMSQSSSTYRNTQSAVNNLSEARAFFHFFESDLSSRIPSTPLISERGTDGDRISFIRAQSHDEQVSLDQGDLRTSTYYVAFTSDPNGGVSPKLFRSSLDDVRTQALIESVAPPAMPLAQPSIDEPIVYHVIQFIAAPKTYNLSGTLEDWTPAHSSPPSILEITLEITDDSTAARHKTEASWQSLRDPSNTKVRENVRSYTRSILLSP